MANCISKIVRFEITNYSIHFNNASHFARCPVVQPRVNMPSAEHNYLYICIIKTMAPFLQFRH